MSRREGRAMRTFGDRDRARRQLVALVAVPAILVGLLAMHFLAGSDEVRASTMAMSANTDASTTAVTQVALEADCAPACLTSSSMTMSMTMTMACVLALLATIVILTVITSVARRDPELTLRLVSLWRGRIASLPPPAPPSLHVLSISRI